MPRNIPASSTIIILKDVSRDMTKPTKWLCAQRRLRSALASAQSDLSLRCALMGAKDTSFLLADSENWSDWADAQAYLSLRWTHTHFVGFVMSRLIYVPKSFVLSTGRGSLIGSEFAWHASSPEFDPHVRHILSWRLGHENISTAILLLPLIQEEQLSVTGERICTKYW